MPKMACHCGAILNLTPIPLAGIRKYHFFSSDAIAQLSSEALKAADQLRGEEEAARVDGVADAWFYPAIATGGTFIVCPECGRLIVSWGDEGLGYFFAPEPPAYGD